MASPQKENGYTGDLKMKCAICDIEMSINTFDINGETTDHITPKSKNGGKNHSNLQTVCRKCNSKKNNKFSHNIKIYNKTDFIFLKNLIKNEIKNNVFDKNAMESELLIAKKKYQDEYESLINNIDDILSKIQSR